MTATALPTVFSDPRRVPLRFRPFKALGHFRRLISDKEDTEQVFHIFEALPRKGFVPDAQAFVESEAGRRLMREEPFLPAILDDHATLLALPDGTVGRAYVDFMQREGLSAAGLVAESDKMRRGRPVFTDQLQWYADRLRDTHDMLHILTGYGRDALGEQCVLAFTYGQTRNIGNAFIAYAGGWEIARKRRTGAPIFAALRQGQRHGTAAARIHEESIIDLLREPIASARARLGIGEPSHYRASHAAFRAHGIDPYDLMGKQAAADAAQAEAAPALALAA